MGFPDGATVKEPTCQCRRPKKCGFNPWNLKIPWRRAQQPTPVFFSEEFHGQRRLVGYSPQGHTEWNTTKTTKAQVHRASYHLFSFIQLSAFYLHCFPGCSIGKESAFNAGDLGWEGNGNALQHSCLGNPISQRSLVNYSPWGC